LLGITDTVKDILKNYRRLCIIGSPCFIHWLGS